MENENRNKFIKFAYNETVEATKLIANKGHSHIFFIALKKQCEHALQYSNYPIEHELWVQYILEEINKNSTTICKKEKI